MIGVRVVDLSAIQRWSANDLGTAAALAVAELESDTSGCGRWLERVPEEYLERLVRFVADLCDVPPAEL